MFVKEVECYLIQNEDAEEKEVEQEVCPILPIPASMCDMFVKLMLDQIIQYMENDEPPHKACYDIGLCNGPSIRSELVLAGSFCN